MSLSFLFGGRGGGFYLDYGMYEELKTVPGYVYNGLFSIGEDSFGTRRMASIWKLFGRYQAPQRKFSQLRHCPCTSDGEFSGG